MMGVVKRIRLPGIPESGKSRVGLGRGERDKAGTERRKKHQGWANEGRLDGQEGSTAEPRNWREGGKEPWKEPINIEQVKQRAELGGWGRGD